MRKPGFILVLTVGLMTVMTIIVARMLMDLTSFQRLESILVDREQAKYVALSGIELAMAQVLASAPAAEEKQSDQEKKFQKSVFELKKIMQHMNRWQTIALNGQHDGIDGSCTLYIACERGKINPFIWATQAQKTGKQQQSFVALDTQKKSIEHMIESALEHKLADWLGSTGILKRLMELLEKRKEPWDDISELLEDEMLKKLGKLLFLTPTRDWALTDCFSLEHTSFALQPWALGKSVAALAGLTLSGTPTDDDMKKIGDTVKQARPAKETWDLVLKTLYSSLPAQEWYGLLSTRFEADLFSVISYGTYRDIIVKLYAIVQRKHEKGPDGSERSFCIIKKLYWIYD